MEIPIIQYLILTLSFSFLESSTDCSNNAKKINVKRNSGSRQKRSSEPKNSRNDAGETRQEPGLGRPIVAG